MEEGSKVVVEFLCCLAMEREREREDGYDVFFLDFFFFI